MSNATMGGLRIDDDLALEVSVALTKLFHGSGGDEGLTAGALRDTGRKGPGTSKD